MKTRAVNLSVTKKMLIEEVIPAIIAKWPERTPWKVKFLHDNVPVHVSTDDSEFIAAGNRWKKYDSTGPSIPKYS